MLRLISEKITKVDQSIICEKFLGEKERERDS
jgi:hypothetical protein